MLRRNGGHRLPSVLRRPGRPLRLLFIFVLGPLPVLFDQCPHGEAQGHHGQQYEQHRENDDGCDLGKYRHGALSQSAGDHAAAVQRRGRGISLLHQQHVAQAPQQHRQQQCAGHPQGHGPPVVEQQDAPRQHQSRSRQPVAVAEKALQQNGQPVDENGTDAEIADEHTQRQHPAYRTPYLPADRPGLGLFPGHRPAAGRTAALFGCGLGCRFLL